MTLVRIFCTALFTSNNIKVLIQINAFLTDPKSSLNGQLFWQVLWLSISQVIMYIPIIIYLSIYSRSGDLHGQIQAEWSTFLSRALAVHIPGDYVYSYHYLSIYLFSEWRPAWPLAKSKSRSARKASI